MKEIYTNIITDRVIYNNDDPERQIVIEEDYTSRHSFLWGLINTKYGKTIRQSVEDKKNTKVGFK